MSGTHNEASTGAAVAAFQRGELDRARSLAEEQLAKGDQAPLLHHLIGLIDCRLGRFDSGIESLKRAVEGDPRNIAYRIILARALQNQFSARNHVAVEAVSIYWHFVDVVWIALFLTLYFLK